MTPTTNAGRALLAYLVPEAGERIAAIEAEAAEAARAEVAAKVRALPVHSIDGYEWDCFSQGETYDALGDGFYHDRDGRIATHDAMVDVGAVLAILEAAPKEDAP